MKAIGLAYPLEISDAELSGRLLASLAHDGQVGSDDLRVLVEDGVATLLGTVDAPIEQDRAERLALRVTGIKRVDNRLTVAIDQYLDDAELLQGVQAALLQHPRLARYRLGARIRAGVVTLLGRVNSLAEEQLAIRAAERGKGVRQVVSGLQFGQGEATTQPVPTADDALLLNQVNAAISDAGVTVYENKSFVRDAMAHLQGLLADRRSLRLALQAARAVPGLHSVRNHLALLANPSSSDPNEALAGRVVQALMQDGRVSPAQVVPVVSDGMVVLSGQVDSIDDHDTALAVAAAVPGVQEVVDNVLILGRGPLGASDRENTPRRSPKQRPRGRARGRR